MSTPNLNERVFPYDARIERHPLKRHILLAILGYKRVISPRNGCSCAYRSHTGHRSRSTFG